uniref:uncharacterized protein isoform X1 n=1 Tax=Pristiophorus japonicus TaxID=55135 RepID=UPI00398EF867
MLLKELLFGLIFVCPLIYWDLASANLLVLGLLWWLLAPPVVEESWDEQDLGTDPGNQQLPAGTAGINQPNNPVDMIDGEVQSSTVLDPSIRQSLRKVFDCSYSQFILLWYNPPEPTEDQPLYQVLLHEFNTTVDHAVGKIRNLDSTRIGLGLIRILTVHLRTAKKEKKREKIFQTREEEMIFLRRTSEALICYLLPESVWRLDCNRHLLREVIALKGLEEVIHKVCDSDFINQMLIKFLDKDAPEIKEEEVISDAAPKTERNDGIDIERNIDKRKKKKKSNKIPNYLKKIFKISKKKADAETGSTVDDADEVDGQGCPGFRNDVPQFKSLSSSSEVDDRVSDSAEEQDFNSSQEMIEWMKQYIFTPTENEKSSLRNCKITISEVFWDEMGDLSCTIDIENCQVAEDCWSVPRKYHEFEALQKELSKTFSSLVEAKIPSVNWMSCDKINNEFKEDVKHQLNDFLELVSEDSILCDAIILDFFSANNQIRDFQQLLTSLFTEEGEETDADSDISEGPCDVDLDDVEDVEPRETNPENRETQDLDSAKSRPSEIYRENSKSDSSFRCIPGASETEGADAARFGRRKTRKRASQKKVERSTKQPECITNQLHDLLGELTCTERFNWNKSILQLLKCVLPFMRSFLEKKLNQFFSKEQMSVYIDCLREILWPNGKPAEPPPERSNEEKTSAKEKAEKLLQNATVLFRLLPHGKDNARILFRIFQDAETNKRLVYQVLVFLLFKIIPGLKDSWNANVMPCLKNLDADELNDKPL